MADPPPLDATAGDTLSVLQRSTDQGSGPGVILRDVLADFTQHWLMILGALAALSFGPSLAGRYLIPWSMLEMAPVWLDWAATLLWRMLRIAGHALAACIVIAAVFRRRHRLSGSLATLAWAAFPTALVVTFILGIPSWIFNAAWGELLRALVALRPRSMEMLFLTGLRLLLELAIATTITTTVGLAVAAAVAAPRAGVITAFRTAFRAAKRWRWTLALFVVLRFLIPLALVFGAAALNSQNLRSPWSFEALRAIEQVLLTALMTLALADIFLRSTAEQANGARGHQPARDLTENSR